MEGSAWQLLDGSTVELLGEVQLEQSSVAPGDLNRRDLGLAKVCLSALLGVGLGRSPGDVGMDRGQCQGLPLPRTQA